MAVERIRIEKGYLENGIWECRKGDTKVVAWSIIKEIDDGARCSGYRYKVYRGDTSSDHRSWRFYEVNSGFAADLDEIERIATVYLKPGEFK